MTFLLYALVLLSGAAALIYEVVWARQLATFLGITSYAQAAVLAAFMLGLAFGSRLWGAWSDRISRPLLLFAGLELGIAASALGGLWLLPRLETLYAVWGAGLQLGTAASYLLRFAVALLVLLPPTFLMGGTLPALVRGLEGIVSRPTLVGRLYGCNTLGAAGGALVAGYVLLPGLGVQRTVMLAAGLNALVALPFLLPAWSRRLAPAKALETAPPAFALPTGARRVVLLALAVSGLAALALQMVWTRALTLVLGSSVYAFSLVLGTFLLGLAGGSLLFARWARRGVSAGRLLRAAIALETALAFAIVLGLPVLTRLPQLFLSGYRAGLHERFASLQLLQLSLAGAVILLPTLLMGAVFPLLVGLSGTAQRGAQRGTQRGSGSDVGAALAANSLGTFLGAPVAVAVLLPVLGIARSVVALGAVSLLLAGVFVFLRRAAISALPADGEDLPGHPPRRLAPLSRWELAAGATAIALFAGCAAGFAWDPVVMTSGPYINAFRLVDGPQDGDFVSWLHRRNRLLYYWEGANATVSVRDDGEERLLVINGKTDGSRLGDRRTQVAVGHLPLLAHPDPRRVLVVGLGTGITAAAIATHPEVERLDIVEVSPGVVAASAYFDDDNRGVLFDSRVRLLQADVRNLLLLRRERYQVIVSEPSNPWISGISNLFTRELYQLAASRLEPDGVMAQWFQSYGMSTRDLQTALATFHSVFPYTTVWLPDTGDLVFLGSERPHRLQWPRLRRLLEGPLAEVDLGPAGLRDARELVRMFLLDADGVASYTAGVPLNTDDRPRIEFSAPRHLYRETTLANLVDLVTHGDGRPLEVPMEGLLRFDPARRELAAFGLSVKVAEGEPPPDDDAAAWRVRWRALVPSQQTQEPQVVVTQERVLHLGSLAGRLEIRVSPAVVGAHASAADALDRLRHLLPGALGASGESLLADGTPAVWALARSPERTTLGAAWSCDSWSQRYDAVLTLDRAEAGGELADPRHQVAQLMAALRCAESP